MILFNRTTLSFEVYSLLAKFNAYGEPTYKYTNEQRYWEEFISRWWHHTDLSFETPKLTPEQQTRLTEINTAKADPAYEHELAEYVEFGVVPPETRSPFLKAKLGTVEATNANLERVRNRHRDKLAAHRYKVEVGGFKMSNGMEVSSDRQSLAMLTSAFQSLSHPFVTEIDWKGKGGWAKVNLQSIAPLADASAKHVQRCFSAERLVDEQMAAITDMAILEKFDVVTSFDNAFASLNQTA